MTFAAAVRSVYRNYATFGGRAPRSEYWWFVLFNVLVSIPMNLIPIADFVWSLVNVIPFVAVTTRRLHDTDRSGWWQILPFTATPLILVSGSWLLGVAVACFLLFWTLLIAWLAWPGTPGPNRFGTDPLGDDAEIFA